MVVVVVVVRMGVCHPGATCGWLIAPPRVHKRDFDADLAAATVEEGLRFGGSVLRLRHGERRTTAASEQRWTGPGQRALVERTNQSPADLAAQPWPEQRVPLGR